MDVYFFYVCIVNFCIDKFNFSSSCSICQHVHQNLAPDAQFRYVAIATLFLLTSGLKIFFCAYHRLEYRNRWVVCKFEGCGNFIKRDIQPRGISAKVPLSLLATDLN